HNIGDASMNKKVFAVRKEPSDVDVILLIIRLVMGFAFMTHGWSMVQNPFHWMGAGSPVPGVFQALAALSEFGGGLALILGLVTRLGALGIAFTMLVALAMHRFVLGDPFINPTGGRSYEPALIYLLLAVFFVIM